MSDGTEERQRCSSERKQSSGDLHSRLKTRKLLGVGETDDGDVHRSKLSQILGHSEQLYYRLPRGTKEWQLITAVTFTCFGVIAVLNPTAMFADAKTDSELLPARLYGGCLITLSYALWLSWKSSDREVIRFSLGGTALYFILQLLISGSSQAISAHAGLWPAAWLLMRLVSAGVSAVLYAQCGGAARRHKATNHGHGQQEAIRAPANYDEEEQQQQQQQQQPVAKKQQ